MTEPRVIFDGSPQPGWRFKATETEGGNARVEIFKDDQLVKSFSWPAYKVWNIPAHAADIIEDVEQGLSLAGATGFGGNVYGG